MTDKIACLRCSKQFTPRRGKKYCSPACRKRDENKRLRAQAGGAVAVPDPVREADMGKAAFRPLRGDETALGEPLAELAAGFSRIAAMVNPTIEAIRRELTGWNIEDERTINIIAWRMKVAPTAIREALNG